MNHIYRLVWNRQRHMLVAVAEHANTHQKAIRSGLAGPACATGAMRGTRTLLATAVASLFPLLALAQAQNPSNCVIDPLDVVELRDDNGSNAAAASCQMTNNGVLDIASTVNGSSLLGLGGSGTVVTGSQTLTLTNANDLYAGTIDGMGGLSLNGGTQILGGVHSYAGATAIGQNAILALTGSGSIALSSRLVNEGRFDIASADSGAQLRSMAGSGSIYLGSQTLTLTNANDHFAGNILGDGDVHLGSGTLILSGAHTYFGATDIGAGATLALSGSGSIALSSGVSNNGAFDIAQTLHGAQITALSGSGTVLLGSQTLTLSHANAIFAGAITGNGGLNLDGGSQTLTAFNSYQGATTIGAHATLVLAGSGAIALSDGVLDNGVLDLSAATDAVQVRSLAGSGSVLLGGQTLVLSQAGEVFSGAMHGSGGVRIDGGNAIFTGHHTYSGDTAIGGHASLSLANAGSIATSGLVDDGVFDISTGSGAAVRSLSGSGVVLLGGQTLTLSSASDVFAGSMVGSGAIHLGSGHEIFTGTSTYTGLTSIDGAAVLALGGSGSIALSSGVANNGVFDIAATVAGAQIQTLSGSGTVLLGGNTLTLSGPAGNFGGVFTGNIDGSGGLHVSGGALALGGANTYTGSTLVDGGGSLRIVADAGLGSGRAALGLDNGTLQAGASLLHQRGLVLSNRGTVDVVGSAVMQEDGEIAGSGSLVKEGTGTLLLRGKLTNSGGLQVSQGTLALSAANTYTGGTTVSTGATLRIDSDTNLGAASGQLTLDGGTLQTSTTMDSARSIALRTPTGTIDTLGADSVVTLNGQVSGAGRLIKQGAGTLVLAGDNGGGNGTANRPGDGWTGGLTINDGLVMVTNAYGLGWGSVLTFNAGTIYSTVDIATGQTIRMKLNTSINTATGTTATLSGELLSSEAGDGCFTKSGQGTLNVTGTAIISATCVNEGKLLANGSFASKVTVARGATLGGAGHLQGDVLVNGTLSPGNSPGMLTADANITMAAGSTYQQDIGGARQASANSPAGLPGFYSYLHVVGAKQFTIAPGATLAPTLNDLYSPGEAGYGSAPYVPRLGESYRIVTVDGGINGRFDTLLQPEGLDSATRLVSFYNADGSNSIDLKVLPASYAAWARSNAGSSAGTVASVLDQIVALDQAGQASSRQDRLLYAVGSYGAATLGGALQGLAGEVHGTLAAAAPQAGWDLQRTVLKHGTDKQERALWLDVTANRGRWDGIDMRQGFDMRRRQVTVGVDLFNSNLTQLGIGASHAGTDVAANAGSGKLRQNKLMVYGAAGAGEMRFDGLASYGREQTDSTRADPLAPSAALSAHASGSSSLLGAGVRAPLLLSGVGFEPFARVTVQHVKRDALAENPASLAALALDAYSATGTRLVAGLAGASRNTDPLQASTLRYNLGAGIDGGALARTAGQGTLADTPIAIGTPRVGRGFAQATIHGTWQFSRSAYLFFGLDGEVRSGYGQVGGNAGVRALF